MPSLLIIAHGSRRAASSDEVRLLAEPGIAAGLAALAAKGETEIVAFPYYLAAGTHVAQDIPEAIAGFSVAHPAVKVRVTPHLGASAALPAAILNVAA